MVELPLIQKMISQIPWQPVLQALAHNSLYIAGNMFLFEQDPSSLTKVLVEELMSMENLSLVTKIQLSY